MAIKGLTDSIPEAGLYPVIGKLRKGAKKTDPKKPGLELEYWRFTSEYPGVEAAFYGAYNAEPKIVNVILPYPKAFGEVPGEVNFTASMEEWRGALVLVHRCDGEYCYRWYDDDSGKYVDDPRQEQRRPCPYSDLAGDEQKTRTTKHPGCRARGRLSVIVPELVAAGHVGVVIVQTGGQHDITHIIGVLNRVQRAVERRDKTLEGVPFTLMRVSEVISTPGWKDDEPGTRRRSEKHNVKLVPVADWESATLAALKDDATAPRLLPASVLDDGNGDDIEGGIIENGAPVEEPEDGGPAEEPEPEPANGDRPYPPETVRRGLRGRAGWTKDEEGEYTVRQADDKQQPPDPRDVQRVAALIETAFDVPANTADDKTRARRAVLMYAFGQDSGKLLTDLETRALLAWQESEADPWEPNDYAVQETRQMFAARGVEKGQIALDLVEEETE